MKSFAFTPKHNREIKHDVIRQTAGASLSFILLPFYRILKYIP